VFPSFRGVRQEEFALHVFSQGFQMARGALLLSGRAVNSIDLEGGSSEACMLPEYTYCSGSGVLQSTSFFPFTYLLFLAPT
jgi:hypothetical protein